MSTPADIVAVIESAYRLDLSADAWLTEVATVAGRQFFENFGGIASFFDRHAAESTSIVTSVTNLGADARIGASLRSAFESGSSEERDRSLRQGGPVLRLSQLAGMPLAQNPFYGPLAQSIGFSDVVVLRAMNPDGTGVFLAAPVRNRKRRGAEWSARWSLIGAHLAAGMRLQRSARSAVEDAGAVFTPGGRVLALSQRAETARDLLRHAAVEMDRARSRRGRRDEKAAVEGWRALVDGRWSLVDHFESDGKRHVIALENAPTAPDPRALLPEERPILHYVAMGHANKLIGYELGLPQGTVATRVASIMRKLGVRSRVEIIDRYMALAEMQFAPLGKSKIYAGSAHRASAPDDAGLTPAEREVALLAQRGLTNQEIATQRKGSPRTVANLLAGVFKKLGVTSRAELTRGGRARISST